MNDGHTVTSAEEEIEKVDSLFGEEISPSQVLIEQGPKSNGPGDSNRFHYMG